MTWKGVLAVSLNLCKEYLNLATSKALVLPQIKNGMYGTPFDFVIYMELQTLKNVPVF